MLRKIKDFGKMLCVRVLVSFVLFCIICFGVVVLFCFLLVWKRKKQTKTDTGRLIEGKREEDEEK